MSVSRFTPVRVLNPGTFEIVEDSEPEREERRRTKDSIEFNSSGAQDHQEKPLDHSVIELSSDNDGTKLPQARPRSEKVSKHPIIIDITDESAESQRDEIFVSKSIHSSVENIREITAQEAENVERARFRTQEDSGDGSDALSIRNLQKFAYSKSIKVSNVRKYATSATLSRSTSQSSAINPAAAEKRKSKTRSSLLSDEFSNIDLNKLRKCVCCDLAWTARKTAVQKLKHTQACGKKNNFSMDTIHTLVANEVTPDVKKGEEVPLKTLLAEVVDDEAPKKKKRGKAKTVETIRSLTDTRNDILSRARFLLDKEASTATSASNGGPSYSRDPSQGKGFGESRLATRFGGVALDVQQTEVSKVYDPTLSFPNYAQATSSEDDESNPVKPSMESSLAKRFQGSKNLLQEDVFSSQVYAPPSTFPMPPGDYDSENLDVGSDAEEEADAPAQANHKLSLHPSSDGSDLLRQAFWMNPEVPNASHLKMTSYASLEHSSIPEMPRKPFPIGERNITPDHEDGLGVHDWQDLSDEDPVPKHEWSWPGYQVEPLYSIPEGQGPSAHRKRADGRLSSPKRKAGGLLEQLDLQHTIHIQNNNRSKARSPALGKTSKSPKSRSEKKSRKPRSKKTEVDKAPASLGKQSMSDEELFGKLRECILKDVDLHHRVLRYEPVHFDVFLQMALDLGLPEHGLKLRVRAFLDSKAIHFYGLTPSGRRTKKR